MRVGSTRLGSVLVLTTVALSLLDGSARAQCSNPNSLWQGPTSGGVASAPATDTGFNAAGSSYSYVVQGSTLYAFVNPGKTGTNSPLWSRSFAKPVQNFPSPVPLKGGGEAIFLAGTDGFVNRINSDGTVGWSVDLRRSTCLSGDQLVATPSVQLWKYADANFQAAQTDDLVFVVTRYGCTTTTANRVYALHASDGSTAWVYNLTGTSQMDYGSEGCAVDYTNDAIYCGTNLPTSRWQPTLWAISTLDGSDFWAVQQNADSIHNRPQQVGSTIYVATYTGTLRARRVTDGTELWNVAITSTANITRNPWAEFREGGYAGLVLATDTSGYLHAFNDTGTTGLTAWPPVNLGSSVTTMPIVVPNLGKAYVGLANGTLHQINLQNGSDEAHAVVGATTVYDPDLDIDGGGSYVNRITAISGSTAKRFCVPWLAGAVGTSSQTFATGPCLSDTDCTGLGDQCNDGKCDTASGVCYAQPKAAGTPCTDTQGSCSCSSAYADSLGRCLYADGQCPSTTGACDVCEQGYCTSDATTSCGSMILSSTATGTRDCPPGQVLCNSGQAAGCINLMNDVNNCGACGLVCAPSHNCLDGVCERDPSLCSSPLRGSGGPLSAVTIPSLYPTNGSVTIVHEQPKETDPSGPGCSTSISGYSSFSDSKGNYGTVNFLTAQNSTSGGACSGPGCILRAEPGPDSQGNAVPGYFVGVTAANGYAFGGLVNDPSNSVTYQPGIEIVDIACHDPFTVHGSKQVSTSCDSTGYGDFKCYEDSVTSSSYRNSYWPYWCQKSSAAPTAPPACPGSVKCSVDSDCGTGGRCVNKGGYCATASDCGPNGVCTSNRCTNKVCFVNYNPVRQTGCTQNSDCGPTTTNTAMICQYPSCKTDANCPGGASGSCDTTIGVCKTGPGYCTVPCQLSMGPGVCPVNSSGCSQCPADNVQPHRSQILDFSQSAPPLPTSGVGPWPTYGQFNGYNQGPVGPVSGQAMHGYYTGSNGEPPETLLYVANWRANGDVYRLTQSCDCPHVNCSWQATAAGFTAPQGERITALDFMMLPTHDLVLAIAYGNDQSGHHAAEVDLVCLGAQVTCASDANCNNIVGACQGGFCQAGPLSSTCSNGTAAGSVMYPIVVSSSAVYGGNCNGTNPRKTNPPDYDTDALSSTYCTSGGRASWQYAEPASDPACPLTKGITSISSDGLYGDLYIEGRDSNGLTEILLLRGDDHSLINLHDAQAAMDRSYVQSQLQQYRHFVGVTLDRSPCSDVAYGTMLGYGTWGTLSAHSQVVLSRLQPSLSSPGNAVTFADLIAPQ